MVQTNAMISITLSDKDVGGVLIKMWGCGLIKFSRGLIKIGACGLSNFLGRRRLIKMGD